MYMAKIKVLGGGGRGEGGGGRGEGGGGRGEGGGGRGRGEGGYLLRVFCNWSCLRKK